MKTRNTKLQLIVGNSFFTIGTCIVIAALIYMLGNLDKADSIIMMWMLFMATGILLWAAGLAIKYIKMWMK